MMPYTEAQTESSVSGRQRWSVVSNTAEKMSKVKAQERIEFGKKEVFGDPL